MMTNWDDEDYYDAASVSDSDWLVMNYDYDNDNDDVTVIMKLAILCTLASCDLNLKWGFFFCKLPNRSLSDRTPTC